MKKRLTIGIIIPQFPSYTETFFISQVIGLCERGYHVNVFCSEINYDPVLEKTYCLKQYANLKVISFDFNRFDVPVIRNIIMHPFIFFKGIDINFYKFRKTSFSNLCKFYFGYYACDIYHFGYSGTAITYLPILKSLPGKIVVSCLGTAENVRPHTELRRILQLKILFARVDKIHCVSGKMSKTIQQYEASPKKIFVNRPAVDSQFFSRKSTNEKEEKIKILSVGRLVFQKGFIIGILAMVSLVKKFSHFTWVIVGEGPEQEELIFTINLFGLNNHIQLAGKKTRNEVYQLYEESDIFLLPSVSEGIANVVLEAMAMQLPVVSSDCGGLSEVINHNVNGILCKNYDYEMMGHQLHELCIDENKRKSLGVEARITIEKEYDVSRYINVFEEEYYKLINN